MSIYQANGKSYDSRGRWQTQTYADVDQVNDDGDIFINGDEFTNGSQVIRSTTDDPVPHLEKRATGVFNLGEIRIAGGSLFVDYDMEIGSLAGFIQTINPSATVGHDRSLIPHIEFDDLVGTLVSQLHVPIANILETFVVFSTPVGEVTAVLSDDFFRVGQLLGVLPGRALGTSVHLVGTVAPTTEVIVQIFVGTDNTGTRVSRRVLPFSDLVVSSTLTIQYDEHFGFDADKTYFMEFASTTVFALQTDVSGNVITSHTGHEQSELLGVTENLMLDLELGLMLDTDLNPMYSLQFP